jgi:hypothetical protein
LGVPPTAILEITVPSDDGRAAGAKMSHTAHISNCLITPSGQIDCIVLAAWPSTFLTGSGPKTEVVENKQLNLV